MSEEIKKDEPIVDEVTPPSVNGPVSFPRLGVIVISVLLGLIIILAIIIAIL